MKQVSPQRVRCESCHRNRVCRVDHGFLVCGTCERGGAVDGLALQRFLVVSAERDDLAPAGLQLGLW